MVAPSSDAPGWTENNGPSQQPVRHNSGPRSNYNRRPNNRSGARRGNKSNHGNRSYNGGAGRGTSYSVPVHQQPLSLIGLSSPPPYPYWMPPPCPYPTQPGWATPRFPSPRGQSPMPARPHYPTGQAEIYTAAPDEPEATSLGSAFQLTEPNFHSFVPKQRYPRGGSPYSFRSSRPRSTGFSFG